MAGELSRGHHFASVAPGDAVQSTCGGDSRPVVGIVRTVTARQFSVKFPGEAVGSANPWFRKFRRADGRSVGDRCTSWAVPAGVAVRCPLCGYQHGHAIGCANNPVDIALAAGVAPAEGSQQP